MLNFTEYAMRHPHPPGHTTAAVPPATGGTQPPHYAPPIERLIRLPELLGITGESRTQAYDNIKAGTHPAPLKDGRASAWLLSEVQDYVAAKVARLKRKP